MKKLLLLFTMMLLSPIVASAHDIEVNNADGVTIYYNYTNDGKELEVTFRGDYYDSYNNEYIGNVVIPEEVTYGGETRRVTSIGYGAFFRCSKLTSVIIPPSVTSIEDWAFRDCTSLTSVTIPPSVTNIGGLAFLYCMSLSSVTIPSSITSLGDGAFLNCTGLTSVTINSNSIVSKNYSIESNIRNIFGEQVKSYIIGDDVTSIGEYAFLGCTGLTSVTISKGVTSIGGAAFSGCTGLTSVIIPSSVTSIGNSAFSGCTDLTVHITDLAAWCRMSFYGYPFYDSEHHLYLNGEEIKDLVIPSSVTSIGALAFKGCTSLTSVTIPSSVTSIGSSAFQGCTSLTSVTIPSSITHIGDGAFLDCTDLTSATINSNSIVSEYNWLQYSLRAIFGEQVKSYIIGDNVTSIGKSAFKDCKGMNSVSISSSVTSIEDWAFMGCTSLISIIVADGNPRYDSRNNCNAIILSHSNTLIKGCKSTKIPSSVSSIGKGAFSGCTGLPSLSIPSSVTSIESSAFEGCTSLTSVTIPSSVTSIGWYAFRDCTGLNFVSIPSSVTSIGGYVFSGCTGLTSVAIPEGVKEIGFRAFEGCTSLTSVTISSSVTSIVEYAFNDCTSLTSVIIGSGVTKIGNQAFDGADISTVISLIDNPFTINGKTSSNRTFTNNTFNNATLYVPIGTIDRYRASEGWKDFVRIEEGNPTGINAVEKTTNNNTTIYDLNGIRQHEPKKGVNIINGKKVVVK